MVMADTPAACVSGGERGEGEKAEESLGEREEDGRKKPAEVRWGTTERMERRTQMQPAAGGSSWIYGAFTGLSGVTEMEP